MLKADAMTKSFNIRLAVLTDAEQIGIIGPAIYAESYSHMWDDAEAFAKQLSTFGSTTMRQFMARKDTAVYVLEYGAQIVGFSTLVIGSPDPIQGRIDGGEVPRIYLVSPARGRGLAKELLNAMESHAQSKGANHLWLDAMLKAPWAWRTYRKWGFAQIGESKFHKGVKDGFDEMVVLRRDCR